MININQLKKKMARYCAWRERCTGETTEKLRESGATEKQVKEMIRWLTEENYLDDARFAHAFVRGKFLNNYWGRLRLHAELNHRKLPQAIIHEALASIDTDIYLETVQNLAGKKWAELKENDAFIKRQKTAAYLISKGFEPAIVWDVAQKLQSSQG
jgi:regulatory protein